MLESYGRQKQNKEDGRDEDESEEEERDEDQESDAESESDSEEETVKMKTSTKASIWKILTSKKSGSKFTIKTLEDAFEDDQENEEPRAIRMPFTNKLATKEDLEDPEAYNITLTSERLGMDVFSMVRERRQRQYELKRTQVTKTDMLHVGSCLRKEGSQHRILEERWNPRASTTKSPSAPWQRDSRVEITDSKTRKRCQW